MDLSGCLERTLSDDLTVASRAAAAGLRILTRGALLVPSPSQAGVVSAWRFVRRQYQMGRIYRPGLWLLAVASIGIRLLAWILALSGLLLGQPLGWAVLVLVVLGVLKQALVGEVARRVGMPDSAGVWATQLALGLLQPLVDLFHFAAAVSAGWTRRIEWSHVVYEVAGPDSIRVKERRPFIAA